MAWAKVDDQWFAHRKVVGLSLCARGLWTTVLSWSCAQKTPHVPFHMARFLAGGEDVTVPAKELVEAGLWHEDEDGWSFHDWDEYQERSLSEKRADAGRQGGKASGEARREANGKQPDVASEADGEAGVQARPVPSRPVEPSPSDDDGFVTFWNAYPRHHDTKALGGGGNKRTAGKRWRALSQTERAEVLEAVGPYAKLCAPGGQKPKHAERFLLDGAWQPYLPSARAGPPRGQVCRLCDRDSQAADHDELCPVFAN
jgi:hypothetical protein